MESDGTVPVGSPGLPVLGIRVEVVEGADAGSQASATDSLRIGSAEGNDLVLTDPTVSRIHLELARRRDRVAVTDLDSTNGTLVAGALLEGATVAVSAGTTIRVGQTVLRIDDGQMAVEERGPERLGDLLGRTPSMRRLFASTAQVAGADVAVMILGESGTGKELVARAIHDHSERKTEPFVTLDCGAMSPNLFASELFGHEKGAFTGADRQHVGAFERAHGGTIFLDEIGELPSDLQPTLLGALERGRFRRVGGTQEINVDVRVVCATNRDLFSEVNSGLFRLDLFYRLSVVRLSIPPLRERTEDLDLLMAHFLQSAGADRGVDALFTDAEMARLMRYRWPGNVRELRNHVLGTLALGRPPELAPAADLSDGDPVDAVLSLGYRNARRELLEEFERRYITAILERADNNVSKAARDAQMDRSYLMELMKRHGFR